MLKDLVKGILQCFKGSPYNKKAYDELFSGLYELFRLAKRDGLLVLETHLNDPHQSPIFRNIRRCTATTTRWSSSAARWCR